MGFPPQGTGSDGIIKLERTTVEGLKVIIGNQQIHSEWLGERIAKGEAKAMKRWMITIVVSLFSLGMALAAILIAVL